MKTQFESRKTAQVAKTVKTVFGEKERYVRGKVVWDFEIEGDINSKIVKKWVPLSKIYVECGLQDKPDIHIRKQDMRSYSVDVHNAKCMNNRKGLGWRTNWEILQDEARAKLDLTCKEPILINTKSTKSKKKNFPATLDFIL